VICAGHVYLEDGKIIARGGLALHHGSVLRVSRCLAALPGRLPEAFAGPVTGNEPDTRIRCGVDVPLGSPA
jgi:hypothetical protein